jgi:hypothetical protein
MTNWLFGLSARGEGGKGCKTVLVTIVVVVVGGGGGGGGGGHCVYDGGGE